jgi:hypothetical protein
MPALTLAEHLKLTKDPLESGVLKDLLRQFKLFQFLPIKSMPGLQVKGVRWQTLPQISTRRLNGSYSTTSGTTEQLTETAFIYGGEYDVDRILMMDKTVVEDPLVTQRQMHIEAVGYKMSDHFINGDHTVDADGFEGLKKRVANQPARMTVNLANAGDSLKVLASTTTMHTFINGLDAAIQYTGATHLFANEAVILGMRQVLRQLNVLLNQTVDNFDRKFDQYAGATWVDVGLKPDLATEVIPTNEDPGDAGNDATSIYAVRFGGEDGLHGIQLEGTSPTPYRIGELQTQPTIRERIDWAMGLRQKGRYAVARIQGFKMAAS